MFNSLRSSLKKSLTKSRFIKFSLLSSFLFLSLFLFVYSFAIKTRKSSFRKTLLESSSAPFLSKVSSFGEDGVKVIDHLYAHSNHFFISHSDPSTFQSFLPKGDYNYSITSLPKSKIDSKVESKKVKKIPGTTVILASEQSMKSMQRHYFHFMEEFLLAWSAHLDQSTPPITTVIFPDIDHWKGVNEINKQILQSLIPNVSILNQSEYKKLSKKYFIEFEQAIFVDRMACHNLSPVLKYNKMAMAHAPLIKDSYLHLFKTKVLSSLNTYIEPNRKPTITYIMRKNRRYVDPEFRSQFLSQLESEFPNCRVQAVWFEKYSFSQQLQIIRNTDVLIGAHGNGLTHAYFLPDKSLVVELFPEDAFAMDYQLVSELSGHTYRAIDPLQGTISETGKHSPPRGNVNQVISKFDTDCAISAIKTFFESSNDSNEGN